METTREIFLAMYRDFNARHIDAVLARMQPDVAWPNRWEGGYVHGHEEVRDYWTRQFAVLNPHVDPVEIRTETDGRVTVMVHQVVRDGERKLVVDTMVRHIYTLRDRLIERMEIEPAD